MWAELEEMELSLLKDLRGLLQSVEWLSRSDSVTPRTTACQASLSITNSRSLLKVMSSNWWCHPTISYSVVPFSSCLQSSPASGSFLRSQFFTYWSFSFSISPSNEYSGLISFRMDWLDLLAVQGTLKSLLQHQSQKHQFYGDQLYVQLSHPYITTGKTILWLLNVAEPSTMKPLWEQ